MADTNRDSLEAEPKAQAEAGGVLPELTSRVVNDACWQVMHALPDPLSPRNWNDFKPAFYKGLQHIFSTPAPQAREPAEPVAWMMRWTGHAPSVTTDPSDYPTERDQGLLIPLYAAPSQAEPAQPHPCSLSATRSGCEEKP